VRFVKTVMLPETVVGTVEPLAAAGELAADAAGALAAVDAVAGGAATLAAAVLGALLAAAVVELAAVPLLLLHAATSEATTSSTPTEVFFTLTISISIRKSPANAAGRPSGIKRFSDRSCVTVETLSNVVKVTAGFRRQSIRNRYQSLRSEH
jgi:hypothetical protein